MLYHTSTVTGLLQLEPRVSSHGIPYVYAIENKVTSMLFGAKKDDFDFLMDEEEGIPILMECYMGAFDHVYSEKSCSVYELSHESFQKGRTNWSVEWVSEQPVKILREFRILDLKEELLQQVERGALILHCFQNTLPYKAKISDHIIDRMIRFNKFERIHEDTRFAQYFPNLIKQYQELISGRFL